MLLLSLVCMFLVPVFLFCTDTRQASVNMTMFLSTGFIIFNYFSEEMMYEETIPGYKEEKARKKEKRRILKEQRKKKRLPNVT
jgi:hypothetical protein